ncbi:MAG: ORF6N domain-containing protein [Bacteroidales bacterium]|nr:ORF6N domain-containing protein [Bacteroidales bacterium]
MNIIKIEDVQDKIMQLRNMNVILDCDVAQLYGVATKEINQAVRNNPMKFPEGFVFQLNADEKSEVVKIFDHLEKLKYSRIGPWAFTEQGLYMLATILRGEQAVRTTICIINTFVKLRELSRTVAALPRTEDKNVQKGLIQRGGEIISDLIGADLQTKGSETELELNFAMIKLKHKIVRKK